MLTATNIAVTFGKTRIVHDISLSLKPAQLVALLGPNGAGKTTLIKTLAGLTLPTSGSITFEGTDITQLPTHERVARGIAYLPQHNALFMHMSILDNLRVIFDYHPYWNRKSSEEFTSAALEMLERVGLSGIEERPAGVLSGGQKRKLEVARALLMQPRVLICDEPFAGVDPKSTAELSSLFTELVRTDGLSILLSDHNVAQLLSHANYVYMVLAGKIVVHGDSDTVRNDTTTRQQYLGDAQI
jgi:lipopolysaccharide export system ATP-binding protein